MNLEATTGRRHQIRVHLRVEAPLPPDLVELGRWLNATWTVEPVAPRP